MSGVCRSGSSRLASDDPGVKGTLGYPGDITVGVPSGDM